LLQGGGWFYGLYQQGLPDSGFEQVLEWVCVGQAWVQPHVEVFPVEHERYAFRVDVVALFVAFLACPFMEAAGRYDGTLAVKAFLLEWAGAQAA
jgi:hypothetical protein